MKRIILSILVTVSLVAMAITNSADRIPEEDYTVHEWGTFTSVSGSDGELIDGLFLEEEKLPGFVHQLQIGLRNGFKFQNVGFPRNDLEGVNIKMETPVIYFYSDKEREVDVNVKFMGGIMDQWYPQAFGKRYEGLKSAGKPLVLNNAVDFRKNYSDSLDWKVKVLSPNSYLSYTNPQNLETPTWVNPRFVDANMLQIGQAREKFIFYRGLARFQQPFKVTAQNRSQITLQNTGDDSIGFAMVYEFTRDRKAKVWWTGSLAGNEQKIVVKKELNVEESIHDKFVKGLITAGLYEKEAKAMLETWRHSYFEKEGLRVFWVVPRKFTDKILPLKLNPAPKNLERVLVGRTEVLTPEFEQQLVRDFTNNSSFIPYWAQQNVGKNYVWNSAVQTTPDRFFKAWQIRVKQLMDVKEYQFNFLKQISGTELPVGEFYIQETSKDSNDYKVLDLFDGSEILSYSGSYRKIHGDVTYHFSSESMKLSNRLSGMNFKDRKAVFKMKNGRLDGECKIYQTNTNEKPVLVKTINFKDGKIL